jgi:hypothetical protein
MGNVEKIEEGNCAYLRYVRRQGSFEHPFPGVRTLLSLLSACLIHSFDPGHGCDLRPFADLYLPQISYQSLMSIW